MSAQIFARLEFHTRIARRVPSGGAKVGEGGKQAAGGGGIQGNGSGNNIEVSFVVLCPAFVFVSKAYLSILLLVLSRDGIRLRLTYLPPSLRLVWFSLPSRQLSSTLPTSTSSASSPGLNFNDLLRTRIPSLQFVMPPPVLTFDPFEGEEERDGGGEGQEVELRVSFAAFPSHSFRFLIRSRLLLFV